MNLLLVFPEERAPDGTVRLTGRRARHANEVLRLAAGDRLRVGELGGLIGYGEVLSILPDELVLRAELIDPPPPRPGMDVLLAVPRPKALKRILPALASLGVDTVVLLNASKVERSYFDSKVLTKAFVHELLVQGLEQGRDTQPPRVLVKDRFRPFIEDELDTTFQGARRLVADPSAAVAAGQVGEERVLVAIGPDGGWVPFELELLRQARFEAFTLGPRVLRVEVAVPYVLGQLGALRSPHLHRGT